MKERSFDEMIAYFNCRVADMDISQDCKMELLGMVTALGYKHEKSAQRWIPCSERLPEEKMNPNTSDFELVICTTTFGDVRAYRFGTPIGWNEPHFWNGIGIMDGYVLAWMYLPEPYKGGEQDE